ncbi:MAG: pyruvate dehydrogenase (acetyl-transferring), homodimeric type [Candidatus Omnitrophica bacterium]|nr:pyruvate dehydrogenase (acetyl-transferring), homodimeric type [Candidatus Omnitrophota bacterium]
MTTTTDNIDTKQGLILAFQDFIKQHGHKEAQDLLNRFGDDAYAHGIASKRSFNTPYINTIPVEDQPEFPGDRKIERRIKSIVRWNALAMVVRANREYNGIGGHISSYASSATLFEMGFNHFFKAKNDNQLGDLIFFQGHAAPGIYSRAYLEGRLPVEKLHNFRRELAKGGGLSSYPHPWLMPDFWQFPSVSMGLPPIQAIYQARFNEYLRDRGVLDTSGTRVWAFVGDGEMDEPESLGALTVGSREQLENLTFVVNCNLQRLDGPVRGNGKVIQELESIYRGAGWNVIKVIWGSDWDDLIAGDEDGLLLKRMQETPDGQYQKYSVETGEFIREDFFGADPKLKAMVEHLSDEDLQKMRRGGHDPMKVYTAMNAAVNHKGRPTVILAKTIKGYGLGEAGEGRNVSHQQKKLNEEELREFRDRFDIPISDEDIESAPFYRPDENSEEMQYLHERRQALGGYVPERKYKFKKVETPSKDSLKRILAGSQGRGAATTMVFGQILQTLLRDKNIGEYIVPIVPDEARTFGLDALFRQYGIYSHVGQNYQPVDYPGLLYYREATDGQLIEEGINEAGAMSTFIAAGTAYSSFDRPMIPFFIYYSMFGFQRIGDLIWAAADQRTRGFLLGATAGRTTLAGEGLQHQDGSSQIIASMVPTVQAYDPAYAYEMAIIIRDGIERMFEKNEDVFYYLTVENENYEQPPLPEQEGIEEGILKGIYKLRPAENADETIRMNLIGSGAIIREALKAQEILRDKYNIAADVFNATSFSLLQRDAIEAERWNMLHPEETPRVPFVQKAFADNQYPTITATDYVRLNGEMIAPWMKSDYFVLGTDGFGRSEGREPLRRFFEVDAECIVLAALSRLKKLGKIDASSVGQAIKDLGIDPEKASPLTS